MGLFGGGSSTSTSKETGSSTTTTNSTAGSDAGRAQLESLLGQLASQYATAGQGYTKEDAIRDSSGAATNAMNQVLQTGVGTVNRSATAGGAYNNTTQDMLSNDLAASAAAASAEVTQNTISNYANITQQQNALVMQSMLSALGLDQSGTQSSTQQADWTKNTTTTTPSSGGGLGGLLGTVGGIAGGVLGSYFGPLGTAIGSSVGSSLGSAVGGGSGQGTDMSSMFSK